MAGFININEVAEYLGVSRMTVYNMVKDGQLPQGRKFRGSRRWDLKN